jgi:hypothetical protein
MGSMREPRSVRGLSDAALLLCLACAGAAFAGCAEASEDAVDGAVLTVDGGLLPGDGAIAFPDASSLDASIPSYDAGAPDAAARDAGPASDAGADAAVDAAAPDAGTAGRLKPKCMKKDSQLIVIGDSYINWLSHTFPDDIKAASGQSWRMEAVGGTSMGSGGIGSIPQQFYDAIARDPDAHTILMDGGGNDVLVPDVTNAFFFECTTKGASTKANCQKIVSTAIATATTLLDKATKAGIRDVIYFFYPHVPANTILSGDDPAEILDYALPMVRSFCEGIEGKTGGKTRCTFIDMIPLFAGHTDWYNEDIHENAKGSAAMAKEIWRVMTDKCVGQKGPKDCCE